MTDAAQLLRAIRAGTRLIVLRTAEEGRAVALLEDVAERGGVCVRTWSLASGLDAAGQPAPLDGVLATATGDDLWVLLEPSPVLRDPAIARALREAGQRVDGPTWIVVEPPVSAWIPPPEAWCITLPPPSVDVLADSVAELGAALDRHQPGAASALDAHAEALARALVGLPLASAERLLAEAVLDAGPDGDAAVGFIGRHKAGLVPTDGLLEPAAALAPDALGGHAAYGAWVRQRALALQPEAEAAGIVAPRGALLLGVQGCGKSLAARTTAHTLGLPLFRLDPGRLFGGTVGASEANLRRVLTALDAMAPVVLWIDEIDKGFAGTGARSDAGTSARVLGGLLTWLAERRRPVFVAATANDVAGLPPELLRRGRLDEIFFFDLPDAGAREEILRIHLESGPAKRLGAIPPMADAWPAFAALAAGADGFSGAEIEAAVTEARLSAFAEGRAVSAGDLRTALGATVPLSVTRAESIQALRKWARGRTRPASV